LKTTRYVYEEWFEYVPQKQKAIHSPFEKGVFLLKDYKKTLIGLYTFEGIL